MTKCLDCGESATLDELNLENVCSDCEYQRELDESSCVTCKTLSLDEYGCPNHKAVRKCVDCCGCLDEKESEK